MAGASPWSVKGVRPDTREAAKDLARREGVSLGEWLNRLIGEVDGIADQGQQGNNPQSSPYYDQTPTNEAPFSEPMRARATQGAAANPEAHQRVEHLQPFPSSPVAAAPSWAVRDSEASRLSQALEALSRRLDAGFSSPQQPPVQQTPLRAANAVVDQHRIMIDRALEAFAHRIEGTEARSDTALGRIDAILSDVRQTQTAISERLRRMEDNDPNHRSLTALRALEGALGQLAAQVHAQEAEAQALEAKVDAKVDARLAVASQEIAETSANALDEKLAHALTPLEQTVARLDQTLIDGLSAASNRMAQSEEQMSGIVGRIDAVEDITTQAIESIDKGLGLVSERVATTEAIANDTNSRLAEALIDLSARLTHLESAEPDGRQDQKLSALEARFASLEAEMAEVGNRIETTRNELGQQIDAALQAGLQNGVDSKIAEVAKALAVRLDASEKRNTEALETVAQHVSRAASTLDQRLRQIEERGDPGREAVIAMQQEMSKVSKAIDDRLASIEQRDAAALDMAGHHIQKVAESLGSRIEQSEQRSQKGFDAVSAQMEQLSARLQARQDQTANSLNQLIQESESRSRGHIEDHLGKLQSDIRMAEDRAKAVSAPLHRDFNQLLSRIDELETRSTAPYAETLATPIGNMKHGQAEDLSPVEEAVDLYVAEDAGRFDPPMYGSAKSSGAHDGFGAADDDITSSYQSVSTSASMSDQRAQPGTTARFGGFGSPLAAGEPATTDYSGLSQPVQDYSQSFDAASLNSSVYDQAAPSNADFESFEDLAPLNHDIGSNGGKPQRFEDALDLDEDPFDMSAGSGGSTRQLDLDDMADTAIGASWDEPVQRSTGNDYLANARLAASRAAAEREANQPSQRRRSVLGDLTAKKDKPAKQAKTKGKASAPIEMIGPVTKAPKEKGKTTISPVVLVAAAALAVTGGVLTVNNMMRSNDEEMPAALTPTQTAPAPAASAPAAAAPAAVPLTPQPNAQAQDNAKASPAATEGVGSVKALPTSPSANVVGPAAQGPALRTATPVATPAVAPIAPAKVTTTAPEMRRFAREQQAKADEAKRVADARLARRQAEAKQAQARATATSTQPANNSSSRGGAAPFPVTVKALPTNQALTPTTASGTPARPSATAATPPRVASVPAAPPVAAAAPPAAATKAPPAATKASAPAGSAAAPRPQAANSAGAIYTQALQRQQAGDAAGAAALMRRAADAGDARALNRLAKMYERGEGVPRNMAQAKALTERAAQRGSRQAMHNLGVYYAEGENGQQDLAKAAESFRSAARKGVTDSQFNLGAMAEQGLGAQKSDREAFYWYSVAGRGGDRDAAAKAREVASRLSPAEKAAEEQRAAAFKAEASGNDD